VRSGWEGRPTTGHHGKRPGNPYDGHTLATVIPGMEALVGKHHQLRSGDRSQSHFNDEIGRLLRRSVT
jgi:hypothetical protein